MTAYPNTSTGIAGTPANLRAGAAFASTDSSSPARVRAGHLARAVRSARLLLVAAAVFATILPGYAQSNADGNVFARVAGADSAALADAKATIVSRATNAKRTTAVSAAGTFEFSGVPVGDYVISLALPGREPLVQEAYVALGATTTLRFVVGSDVVKLEKFVVNESTASPIDVASTEVGLNIRAETVKLLPVARDLTSVALLTPGVSRGDTGYFGNLSSFAGASVAENAYYLNGFNITDFRRGLGYGTVPFEFFQDFKVSTTGYSAEFGRSTGGVVNASSKRGSNQFKASASVYWEPSQLNENGYDSYRSNGALYIVRTIGSRESRSYNFEASGPLWKDHLFIYGLYQARDEKSDFISGTNQWHFQKSKDPFWAGKVDYQISPNHALEYTIFNDERTTTTQRYAYPLTSTVGSFNFTRPTALGASQGNLYADAGGRSHIGRYSGSFLDNNLTLTALYGESTKNASNRSDVSGDPYIVDQRVTTQVLRGAASVTEDLDRRKAYRIDGVYRFSALGSHALKFGYDLESNRAHSLNQNSGGISYTYQTYTGAALPNGATAPTGTTQIATKTRYFVGGDFKVITEAFYAEDNWKLLNDRLSLNLGLRREGFDNRNGNDKTFIKLANQLAPRVSASYDLAGDGLSKVFGSWGRYFLQIPANTNVRLAGGETYYSDYYVLNGVNADSTPVLGAQIGNRVTTGNGIVPDTSTIVNAGIGPMYQDEFVLGYERALNKKWSASVTAVFRDLKQVIEDEAVDAALLKYAAAKGYNKFEAGGFDYYVLTNPGADLDFYVNLTTDRNGDGVVDIGDQDGDKSTKQAVHLPAADLGYPKASRKYYALELKLERQFVDKWFANFSYVWAHLYGNYEGSVYSDIGQKDAGITQLFDQPGLVDGTYGDQPNDRRHTFKAWGGYQLTKEVLVSTNFSAQSGRPISALGLHPTDLFARAYGASSYYVGGVLSPRGSQGRTPWVYTFDLSAKYKPTWGRRKLSFGLDVFNVANWQTVTGVFERAETSAGAKEFRYKRARTLQTPRYVRVSASYDF